MSKKKGEGLKSFNRGFNVPDTYIIIFFVVVIAEIGRASCRERV